MRGIFLACLASTTLALAAGLTQAQAAQTIRVAYAGSMGVVMDRFLGPAFAKAHEAQYQGIGQGAYGLAHLLAAKKMQADVFVSVTPGPIEILKKAGLIGAAVPVASTQMVIAYSPKSRFAPALKAASAGGAPWWQVLQSKGLRFGRTDPATDPQGQNIILMMKLAGRYYHQPNLAKTILGPTGNPAQIFTEPSLLSRLESGQLDASSGYQSAVISHHLPYVKLPDQLNLSNPAMVQGWYSKVNFRMVTKTGQRKTVSPQPLVFYATVLNNAPDHALGEAFLSFLQSPAGQTMLKQNGYAAPKGGNL